MVSILRQVLEMYDVILTSAWFWLAYTLIGIRTVWTEYSAHPDEFRAAPPAIAAVALILAWASWPWAYIDLWGRRLAWWWLQRQKRRAGK